MYLEAGDHAVHGVCIDGVGHLGRLAQAQDGRNKEHCLRHHAVRCLALQLPQPQQQLC